MKKLFIVLAVASLGFAACGNEGEKKEGSDTPAVKVDSPAVVTPAPDTTVKTDTAAPVDTTKK